MMSITRLFLIGLLFVAHALSAAQAPALPERQGGNDSSLAVTPENAPEEFHADELKQERVSQLLDTAKRYMDAGRHSIALDIYNNVLLIDPHNEVAKDGLYRASLAAGAETIDADPAAPPAVSISMQIYQVSTDITGDGLTSQTLEGSAGTLQVLHERWGSSRIRMEGEILELEHPVPEPGVTLITSPRVIVHVGESATIRIGEASPLQYLEPVDATTFKLKDLDVDELQLGVNVSLKAQAHPDQAGLWDLPFQLRATFVSKRAPVPGLHFNAGKPEIDTVTRDERITLREGEYGAYRTQIPGRSGMLYVFFLAERHQPSPATQSEAAPQSIRIETRVVQSRRAMQPLKVPGISQAAQTELVSMLLDTETSTALWLHDSSEDILLSAPRMTLQSPATHRKTVFGEKSYWISSTLKPPFPGQSRPEREPGWLHRMLFPQGIVPENHEAAGWGTIADITEEREGILVSALPEVLPGQLIRLDYLLQLKMNGLSEEFRQTFTVEQGQTQVFLLPQKAGEGTVLVLVTAQIVDDARASEP